MQPASKGTGDGNTKRIDVKVWIVLVSIELIVPEVIDAAVDTWTLEVPVSTVPLSPARVWIENPSFSAVEIGFRNPDTSNTMLVPAVISAVKKASDTLKVSFDSVKDHDIVLSRLLIAEHT